MKYVESDDQNAVSQGSRTGMQFLILYTVCAVLFGKDTHLLPDMQIVNTCLGVNIL